MTTTAQPLPLTDDDRRALLVPAALTALYLIWGSTYLGLAVGLESFPPFLMNAIRFWMAAGLVFFVLVVVRRVPLPPRREALHALLVGVLTLGMGVGGVAYAQQWVSSGLAALAVAATPLWVAVFSAVLTAKSTRLEWAGMIVGFSGIVLLNLDNSFSAQPEGALPLLLAPISWSLGSVLSRRLTMPRGFMAIGFEMLGAALFMTVAALLLGERLLAVPTLNSVLAIVYLGLFGSLIGYTSFMYLMKHVSPALATSYAYVNPVVALALGVLLLGEGKFITPTVIVASIVTLSGVALVAYASARRSRTA
jgi:drug/metabolite transporter (DMT)-like permease